MMIFRPLLPSYSEYMDLLCYVLILKSPSLRFSVEYIAENFR